MQLNFTKMHGAGNDFVIIDATEFRFDPDPAAVRKLTDRRRGVGCDQLLVLDAPTDPKADFAYRIYNAVGEAAEQCGNGARCIAWLAAARRGTSSGLVRLESPAGPVEARVGENGEVSVNMGEPVFDPDQVPFITSERADYYGMTLDGEPIEFGVVSMGNPHAVCEVEDVEDVYVASIGRRLGADPRFPKGVNVGFVEHVDRTHLRLRVYERGAGETLACGTGACAAAAITRARGTIDASVAIDLRGGRLMVSWDGPGGVLWLTGPATRVFDGAIDL